MPFTLDEIEFFYAAKRDLEFLTHFNPNELKGYVQRERCSLWVKQWWNERIAAEEPYLREERVNSHVWGLTVGTDIIDDRLALIQIESNDKQSNLNIGAQSSTEQIIEEINKLFQNFEINNLIPIEEVKVHGGTNIDGNSLSLSIAILALSKLFDLRISQRICATGGWGNDKKFKPVNAETLNRKLLLAKEFHFEKIFVAREQEGINIEKNPPGIEIIYAEDTMAGLLMQLIEHCQLGTNALHILSLMDFHSKIISLETIKNATSHVINKQTNPINKSFAYEVLASKYRHEGLTEEAEENTCHALKVEDGIRQTHFLPNGHVGDFYYFERNAGRLILDIDTGMWSNSRSYEKVESLIAELKNRELLRKYEFFMLHCLNNSRARFDLYRGKLEGNVALIDSAWGDATDLINIHVEAWKSTIEYAQNELMRADTDKQRHFNFLVEILSSKKAT